jgi:cobalamin biosynthesis Mg chelatase CobN
VQPPIPLTLRGMHGSCHPRRRSHRPALVLFSVFALLAFAGFSVASAGAETVYDPQETTIPTEDKPPKTKNNSKDVSSDPKANGSTSPESEETDVEGESDGTSSPGGGNGGGDSGQSNGDNGSKDALSIASAEKVPNGDGGVDKRISDPQPASDDGGSSPLVPILIAIAALAAVSIGVVVMRNRRGDSDGPVSPKAS